MQRDGQKVARIRHQQHSRAGPDTPGTDMVQANGNQEMKRKMEMSPYAYNNMCNITHISRHQCHLGPCNLITSTLKRTSTKLTWNLTVELPTTYRPHNSSTRRQEWVLLLLLPIHPAPPQNQQEVTSSQGEEQCHEEPSEVQQSAASTSVPEEPIWRAWEPQNSS